MAITKREKRLRDLRRNPTNVSASELETLLVAFGFTIKRQKGSHRTYTHPDFKGRLLIAQHRRLDVAAVKDAIVAIDEVT